MRNQFKIDIFYEYAQERDHRITRLDHHAHYYHHHHHYIIIIIIILDKKKDIVNLSVDYISMFTPFCFI